MTTVFPGRIGSRVVPAIFLAGSLSQASAAPVRVATEPGGRVTGLSNLVPRENCLPSKLRGRVVKRDFVGNGLHLSGITVEEGKGTRTFVNVDNDYAGKDAAVAGRIKAALESLLAVGRKVDLGVFACGAGGRVLTIHSVTSL